MMLCEKNILYKKLNFHIDGDKAGHEVLLYVNKLENKVKIVNTGGFVDEIDLMLSYIKTEPKLKSRLTEIIGKDVKISQSTKYGIQKDSTCVMSSSEVAKYVERIRRMKSEFKKLQINAEKQKEIKDYIKLLKLKGEFIFMRDVKKITNDYNTKDFFDKYRRKIKTNTLEFKR